MDKYVERVCCQEVLECEERMDEAIYRYNHVDPFECITEHPGFIRNCLQDEVLENAWLVYRQQYGRHAYEGPRHKLLRHVAYRQLAHFLFGIVGREVRYVLPSCAVKAIRGAFPPAMGDRYTGFLDV